MRRTRKTLVLAIALLAMITASVLGTVAYLTDTASVSNTFTVGKVEIKLDEAVVDENGKATDDRTEEGNDYHMIPGKEFDKDPTITVLQNSEEAYYRMMVTMNCASALKEAFGDNIMTEFFTGYDANVWQLVEVTYGDDDTCVYEFRYIGETPDVANGDVALQPLFTGLKVPETFDNEDLKALEGFQIDIEGHAIQKYGFENADAAWAGFDKQYEGDATTGNGGESDDAADEEDNANEDASEDKVPGASDADVKL